jgi:hypothetical protein
MITTKYLREINELAYQVEAKQKSKEPDLVGWVSKLKSMAHGHGVDIAGELEMQGQEVDDQIIDSEAFNYAVGDLIRLDKEFAKWAKDKKNLKSIKKMVLE